MSTPAKEDEAHRTQQIRHNEEPSDLQSAPPTASPLGNGGDVRPNEPAQGDAMHHQPVPSTGPPPATPAAPTAAEAAQMFVFSAAKAGMKDVDKDHVQKVVYEMSKDSLFFQNSIKQNDKVEARIVAMRTKLQALTLARRETLRRQIDAQVAKMETTRDLTRTKVVVDMDMFYAAVEMRDNPALRDVPLAVGGIGMLSTTNYVARKFGVRAAMPGFIGKELCPELVIVPCNFEKYTVISTQIRAIVEQYDPDYRAMSLDEVYCDITEFMENNWPRYARTGAISGHGAHSNSDSAGDDDVEDGEDTGSADEEIGDDFGSDEIIGVSDDEETKRSDDVMLLSEDLGTAGCNRARKRKRNASTIPPGHREVIAAAIVNEIRQKIFETTQLTASAGIAANTMLAKICSDFNKPNGQYVLPFARDDVLAFVEKLPVRKIGGIGKVMEKTLSSALAITTGKDLYDRRVEIFHLFSERTATWLLRISMGLKGTLEGEERSGRKSYSRERTFSARGIGDPKTLEKICDELCDRLAADMYEGGHGAKTITLKLKCVDFSVRSRAVSTTRTVRSKSDLFAYAVELLRKEMPLQLRLMGVRASALVPLDGKSVVDATGAPRKRQAVMDKFTTSTTTPSDGILLEAMEGLVSTDEDDCDGTRVDQNVEDECGELPSKIHGGQKRQLAIQTFTQKHASVDMNTLAQRSQPKKKANDGSSNIFITMATKDGQEAAEFQPCPVCGKMINAGNVIAVNLHVDACLRRSEGEDKRRSFKQFFRS